MLRVRRCSPPCADNSKMPVIMTHSTADLDGVAAVTLSSRDSNLRETLKHRLPAPITRLLQEAGELADHMDLSAYVVGGLVRDLLLDLRNLDLDIVIEGDGIAFARALGRDRKARVKTHERFGTAVVIFPDGFKLDVATARTESYEYPTALPTVEPSSIKNDLYRRDFTINTMAVGLNARNFGELIDFYGGPAGACERKPPAPSTRRLMDAYPPAPPAAPLSHTIVPSPST